MGKKDYRTLFLREFVKTLIQNTTPKKELFPHHPVKPSPMHINFPGISQTQSNLVGGMTASIKQTREVFTPTPPQAMPLKPLSIPIRSPQPNPNTINLPQRNLIKRSSQEIRFQPTQQTRPQNMQIRSMIPRGPQGANPIMATISPTPQPIPQGFSLIKIDSLINDNRITAIECAGPGKPLIVKSLGKVSPTRISLSETEIKKVIETFSKYSRIPMMEGMFKAAVGNTLITAVVSDFVGSRFIINKYTPYSLLERQM
ncbi:MAG: hypothetical protein ABH840_02380 [Nanoarchaeota archaeon]